jgi:hypothetical protein
VCISPFSTSSEIFEDTRRYEQKWRNDSLRMERDRLSHLAFRYRSQWRREMRRPKRRWRTKTVLVFIGTGLNVLILWRSRCFNDLVILRVARRWPDLHMQHKTHPLYPLYSAGFLSLPDRFYTALTLILKCMLLSATYSDNRFITQCRSETGDVFSRHVKNDKPLLASCCDHHNPLGRWF